MAADKAKAQIIAVWPEDYSPAGLSVKWKAEHRNFWKRGLLCTILPICRTQPGIGSPVLNLPK
jgi:hypothetical protein